MINGHGGNVYEWAKVIGCSSDEIIDMSSNINPLGSPPLLLDDIKERLHHIHRLPEVDSKTLIRTFAVFYDKHVDQVTCAAGTTEFIYHLPKILNIKKALIIGPTYADYADACIRQGAEIRYLIAEASQNFQAPINDQEIDRVDTVFLCNPNNPSGHFIPIAPLKAICKSHPDVRFIVDESYLHFNADYEYETMIRCGLSNVIVLCSFSKIFAIPGLRLGFMVGDKQTINAFRKQEKPWNVNIMAQIAGIYLFKNMLVVQEFIQKTALHIQTEKIRFQNALACYPHVQTFADFAPFMLIKLPDYLTSKTVCSQLAQKKFLIRDCSNFYGLSEHFIRIAYKDADKNIALLEHLSALLKNEQESKEKEE
ncbi:MAG: aminotransferase class I/II-fold pyridoxal phosphate-dependent enzyme [Candidatus Magnetomorum sp.]|nr:aminotransferase class I/II-fold pyridoxal phosphate-dependent enzyme [Candidatus Magnetomorum sp.]